MKGKSSALALLSILSLLVTGVVVAVMYLHPRFPDTVWGTVLEIRLMQTDSIT